MAEGWKADALVTAKSENVDRFKHTFLTQAICELRFPTVIELGEQKTPPFFLKALRREFPYLDVVNEVQIGNGHLGPQSSAHVFKSPRTPWVVTLRHSSLVVETFSYSGFPKLKDQVISVLSAVWEGLDADFLTRVGLRYINVIGLSERSDQRLWINPALTGPLMSNAFSSVSEYAGKLVMTVEDGGCLLQHGVNMRQVKAGSQPEIDYVIDIDAFRLNIEPSEMGAALDAMHSQAFDVFDWSLGDAARDHLKR